MPKSLLARIVVGGFSIFEFVVQTQSQEAAMSCTTQFGMAFALWALNNPDAATSWTRIADRFGCSRATAYRHRRDWATVRDNEVAIGVTRKKEKLK